jgi:hypothetical protein
MAGRLAIPRQETLTVADFLGTNFFDFGVPMELHSDQGRNFESSLMHEVLYRHMVSKIRTIPLTPLVRWNGGTLREDDRGEPEQGGFYSPTGLGREATYLPAGLPSIKPHHRRDAYHSVFGREFACPVT